jgi:hypothetical protein
MKTELMNLFLFIGISLVVYLLFRNFNYNNQYSLIEGMTDASTTQTAMAPSGDGVAGNAASYGAQIKAATIKLQDTFLITKYRRDYEAVILNLDDFINNLMLKNALSFDKENPEKSLTKLVQLQEAKLALNSVMKFVDSQ